MRAMSAKYTMLISMTDYTCSDVRTKVVEQGICDGRGWALVHNTNNRRDLCSFDYKHEFRLAIDFSEYRNGAAKDFMWNEPETLHAIDVAGQKKTFRAHLINTSPSWWDNGFGRCDYLSFQLFSFRDSKWHLKEVIRGEQLFSPEDIPELTDWSIVAKQVCDVMKPDLERWSKLAPLLQRGNDDF